MGVIQPLLRAGAYVGVLVMATTVFVGSLDFSFDRTVRHIAELRATPDPARLRPSYIAPTPALAAKDLDAARLASVTATGEAARAQMGLAAIDPLTTGSVPDPAAEPGRRLFRVGASALNVRSGPSKGSAKVMVLSPGEEVHVAETQRSWVRVVLADGRGGWVFSKYLVPVE
jgi:hypothetical protein